MAHAQAENYAAIPAGAGKACFHVWKLVRTMVAAGWSHLASSDGYTTPSTTPGTDKWATLPQSATTVTATFTQPAISSSVTVAVGTSSWMTNGMVLYINDSNGRGGVYTVNGTPPDGTHVSLTNTGFAGPPANTAAGQTIGSGTCYVSTFPHGAWWLGQGPSTLKIPFTSAVTGTFIRGENISQNTTSATGEVIGVVWDGSSAGYLVVMPRTGTFDNANVITGGFSGATVTPNGTIVTYVRQVVFWMDQQYYSSYGYLGAQGHIYYQCVDPVAESAEQFSQTARLAAALAAGNTIAPGGSTSGANSFPGLAGVGTGLGSFVVKGQGGSGGASTGSTQWHGTNQNPATYPWTNAQIMCANCTPSSGVSADGSFILAMSANGYNSGAHWGFAFQRCDNNEDGDVDPYVWFGVQAALYSAVSRTAAVAAASSVNCPEQFLIGLTTSTWWGTYTGSLCSLLGWRRRGLSGESTANFSGYAPAFLALNGTSGANSSLLGLNTTDPDKVSSAAVTTYVREPIWVVNPTSSVKSRKGTLRWLYTVNGNSGTDTYDGKKWIQFGNTSTTYGAMVGGPADGSTTPSTT